MYTKAHGWPSSPLPINWVRVLIWSIQLKSADDIDVLFRVMTRRSIMPGYDCASWALSQFGGAALGDARLSKDWSGWRRR